MSESSKHPGSPSPVRRWRFSLRTLLLVVVAAAIAAALVGRVLRQRAVVAKLRQMGVDVKYDSGVQTSGEGEGGQVQSFTKFEGDWVLENDFVYDVHAVLISARNADDTLRWWSAGESRQVLALTAELPDVRWLFLNRCVVRKPDLAQLPCLSQLTDLDMYDVDVRDEDLEPLRHAHNLIKLQMYRVPVGDKGFGYLEGLNKIEVLDLAEVRITDEGLAGLARLPRLRELSLSSDWVTDRGMVALGQSNSLRILSLNCKNVGDRGAAELAKLRNLEQITLYGTQLTDAGAELLADLPNLQVARLDGRKSRKSVAPASNLEKEP